MTAQEIDQEKRRQAEATSELVELTSILKDTSLSISQNVAQQNKVRPVLSQLHLFSLYLCSCLEFGCPTISCIPKYERVEISERKSELLRRHHQQ